MVIYPSKPFNRLYNYRHPPIWICLIFWRSRCVFHRFDDWIYTDRISFCVWYTMTQMYLCWTPTDAAAVSRCREKPPFSSLFFFFFAHSLWLLMRLLVFWTCTQSLCLVTCNKQHMFRGDAKVCVWERERRLCLYFLKTPRSMKPCQCMHVWVWGCRLGSLCVLRCCSCIFRSLVMLLT